MRSAVFREITQRRIDCFTDIAGQITGPIFLVSLTLENGTGRLSQNYRCTLYTTLKEHKSHTQGGRNQRSRTYLVQPPSFNRTQSRVVTGLLTGHNTLRRHLYRMELSNNHTCRKCGTEEENSVHILCECEALTSLRRTYLCSFFLGPEDIRKLGMGGIWNFAKGTGLL